MVCTRIALCMHGAQYIALPDGSTCECLDRYPYFAIVGAIGFTSLYVGGLRYRAEEQHLSNTKDLRFQTSFQIVMVLARSCKSHFCFPLDKTDKFD